MKMLQQEIKIDLFSSTTIVFPRFTTKQCSIKFQVYCTFEFVLKQLQTHLTEMCKSNLLNIARINRHQKCNHVNKFYVGLGDIIII